MTIAKAGELIDHCIGAVQENGATPETELFVRIGSLGATYRIDRMVGQTDQRGMRLILQTEVVPFEI